MPLLMIQDIHLILHLAHLGEQRAQLRQSVVGFEIGRRNHLGQGGSLRLQLQHRGQRLGALLASDALAAKTNHIATGLQVRVDAVFDQG